jgi:SulP family sulfate permease
MSKVSDITGDAAAIGSHRFKVRLPFVAELRHYSWEKLRADLGAGSTFSLVSIPQAICFALILNLPPQPVIAAIVVGGFVGALFFSSHHHVFGPTCSISLIVAATIAANRGPTALEPLQTAIYLAILIGAVQLLAGLLNFGGLTKFISRSVVVGYGTGLGILLVGSQLHNLLGYDVGTAQSFLADRWQTLANLPALHINPWAVGIGLIAFSIFETIPRLRPSWPGALVGLAVLGIAAKIFTLYAPDAPFRMVKDESSLTAAIPSFAGFLFDPRKLQLLSGLVPTAVAIAFLGMLEAAAITNGLAAQSGQKIEPNQELVGMGVANIACALFGAVPGSSSYARSSANFQSGAVSQLSSMLGSAAMVLVLLFATPVFNYIPVAALAALLIRTGIKMIDLHQIRIACRSTRSDAVVFLVTLGAALLLPLDTAIYVGIGVSLALFLQKTTTPTLAEYSLTDQGDLTELTDPAKRPHPQISIVHVEGELYFGAAELFQQDVRRLAGDQNIRVFILRMKNARHLDASTVMALDALHEYLRKTSRYLLISGCNQDVAEVLARSGLLQQIGAANIFPAEANATLATRKALKRAQCLLPSNDIAVRVFYDNAHLPSDASPTTPPPLAD